MQYAVVTEQRKNSVHVTFKSSKEGNRKQIRVNSIRIRVAKSIGIKTGRVKKHRR